MSFKLNPLTGNFDLVSNPSSVKIAATKTEMFSLDGTADTFVYVQDVNKLYVYDDGWKELSTLLNEREGAVDIGYYQDSNLAGYDVDYVDDKTLFNCVISGNNKLVEGAVRRVFSSSLNRNLFQVYLSNSWQTILTGINIQTDDSEKYPDIEFTDFTPWVISLINGNSDLKDLVGDNLVKEMKVDMGVYSSPLVIDGGSF